MQGEVKRLGDSLRLEKDNMLAVQQELEETKQSWAASENEANTALAASHSYEVPFVGTHLLGASKELKYTLRTIYQLQYSGGLLTKPIGVAL